MALPSNLSSARLRDLAVRTALGEPVPGDDVAAMIDTLETLLDEAQAAEEEHGSIDDLVGAIEHLEKLRAEAVDKWSELEDEHEQKLDALQSEHAKECDELRERAEDIAKTADEYRARAEKAEHALLERPDAGAAKLAEDLQVEREYSATLHAEVRELQAEVVRFKHQTDRAAGWWEQKAAAKLGDELARAREHARAQARAREDAEREHARLTASLRAIVAGEPKDAHRQARIALGREVLEATGTAASEGYIPSRAEMRRKRAGGAKR